MLNDKLKRFKNSKKFKLLISFLKDINIVNSVYIVGGTLRDIFFDFSFDDIDLVITKRDFLSLENNLKEKKYKYVRIKNIYRVIFSKEFYIDFLDIEGDNIESDLKRRDYTINNLAYEVFSDKLISIGSSLSDLKNKILRPVLKKNILDDPLRIIRGLRFLDKYNLRFCCFDTIKLFKDYLSKLLQVDKNRLRQEFIKIVELDNNFISLYFLYYIGFFNLYKIDISKRNWLYFLKWYNEILGFYRLFFLSFDILKLDFLAQKDKKLLQEFICHYNFLENGLDYKSFSLYLVENKKEINFIQALKLYLILNNKLNLYPYYLSLYNKVKDKIKNPIITGRDIVKSFSVRSSPIVGVLIKKAEEIRILKNIENKEDLLYILFNIYKNTQDLK